MANPKPTLLKKKKKWYTIVAPKEMNNVAIGETLASEPETLKGRVVQANLMTITNDMKKQNMTAVFKVTDVKESVAETELTAYYISQAHIKRLSKRAREKVEDSFKCQTKDNQTVIVKPFLLLRSKVQRGVMSSLRHKSREELANELKNKTFMEFVSTVLSGETQKNLKLSLKKIYPLNAAEIRVVELA